ncbi:MAG: hypothetical protein AAGC68_12705, partial [Verrucomicrobiota bacterium]
MRYLKVGIFLAAAIGSSVSVATLAGEWRKTDGIHAFHFDTPEMQGMFVARDERDLGKGFGRHGLRGLVLKPLGEDIHAPEGPAGARRRHQGIMNLYRVYGAKETFGSLRDDLAEV